MATRSSTLIGSLVNTAEAAESAGISVRQLDHWARNEILTPVATPNRGSGRHRLWTIPEIKVARLLGELSSMGVSLRGLTLAAQALEGVSIEPRDKRKLVVTRDGQAFITTHEELAKKGVDCFWSVSLNLANR
jgi:DNA-binding transcriptional MerR regulator